MGAEAGRRFGLGTETHIGRSPDNDLCLADPEVSRKHALLLCREDGCELYDLDSQNGTWVNGVRVTQPLHVQVGDTILVGDTSLQLGHAGR